MDEFDKIVSNLNRSSPVMKMGDVVMDMPDVTRAQIIALVQAALGCAVAFGAPITEAQSISMIGLVSIIAAILIHSDRGLRAARNETRQVEIAAESELEQVRMSGDE